MLGAAKARASRKGLPFNLTLGDLTLPATCPVLGIDLDFGAGAASDHSPSLDRIVPALGYVRGNVLIVSTRANRIKNDASVEELRRVAAFYETFIRQHWMQP